jgi:hypothetical protein
MAALFLPHSSPIFRAFLFAFPLFWTISFLSAAPPPPASPSVGKVDGSPRVVRGGECEIVLRGIVMPRDSVEFKIHKGPRHGSLLGPRPLGNDAVAYLYRHNGNKGAESDRIDFKLKTGPNNTWGRITATIAIDEPPARLEVAESRVDFGPVPIGRSRSAFLALRNGGGGYLLGALEAGAPWSIDGPAEFELAEGESRNIRVVFSPDGPGERQGRLDVVAGSDRHPVILRGEGVYRFDAPERISRGKSGENPALKIPLTNLTDFELPLSVVIPAPLLGEATLVLPASGVAMLELGLEKRHYAEKFVDVVLSDGLAVRKVRVALPDPPALLEWASEGGEVDLGEVPARHIPRPEFELRNRGATAAMVRIRAEGEGLALVEAQAQEFQLLPGESALVKTVWRLSDSLGLARATLIASHGGLDRPLRVQIRVAEPTAEPEPTPLAAEAEATPPPDPRRLLSEAEQKEKKLRRPFDIETRALRGGSEVAWKYSGPEPVLFWLEKKVIERAGTGLEQIFERRLQVPEELPQPEILEKWVPVPSAEARIRRLEDGSWIGSVPGLEPGFRDVRIATRTPPDAKRIDYSEFVVQVYPPPPNPLWRWLAGSIGIFCLGYLLRKKLRRFFNFGSRDE